MPREIRVSRDGLDMGDMPVELVKAMLFSGELTPWDHFYDYKRREWINLQHHPIIAEAP
jgi:hypothetical protein